jgi:hypothetical protein
VPEWPVSVSPSVAVPVTVGAEVFTGATGRMTAVAALDRTVVPLSSVAVTWNSSLEPTSPWPMGCWKTVAPEIGAQLARAASHVSH